MRQNLKLEGGQLEYNDTIKNCMLNNAFNCGILQSYIQNISIKMEGRGRNPVSANIMDITIKYFFSDVKTLFKDLS